MKKLIVFSILLATFQSCSPDHHNTFITDEVFKLYSLKGREHQVQFEAVYLTQYSQISDLQDAKLQREIKQTTKFLFGPTTHRQIAGIQKGEKIIPHIEKAYLKANRVAVPYTYRGVWLIDQEFLTRTSLIIPVPLSEKDLRTSLWQRCTDSAEDHSMWSFFWYFWDPLRAGCDHKIGKNYQEVELQIGDETPATTASYPEYRNLIQNKNGSPTMAMTFAFGYVEDVANPNPFNDQDYGMYEFQKFYRATKKIAAQLGLTETAIYQKDITAGSTRIGARFRGQQNGVQIEIKVIAAAGVDQMDIFANSYAHHHDGFFGWFGHSRVGDGFDADRFKYALRSQPEKFSVSPNYQIIYWAGCNSYSYYTLPFFQLKSDLDPTNDPHGTRKLDLISNALPSLFAFNSYNAQVLLQALLNWQNPTSYQSIINQVENYADSYGQSVLVNVLGDEDNIL